MKNEISSDYAPKAIGPYSQALEVTTNRMLFMSGQIPLDPKTMTLVEGGIESQTEQVLQNMKAVLQTAGLSFANVVKATIFLQNMGDFPIVNGIYDRYFQKPYPARSTVQVAKLPKEALIEIEAIAVY